MLQIVIAQKVLMKITPVNSVKIVNSLVLLVLEVLKHVIFVWEIELNHYALVQKEHMKSQDKPTVHNVYGNA